MYIIGLKGPIGDTSWRIEKRRLSDGDLIWYRETNLSPSDDVPYGITVDSTAMYLVGFDNLHGGRDYAWRFEKRDLSDGSLIWSDSNNPSPIRARDATGPSMDLRARTKVEKEFKTREQKNTAIELLTAWNRKPTWKEMKAIGSRPRRKEKAVKAVMDRLAEADLFTEARG